MGLLTSGDNSVCANRTLSHTGLARQSDSIVWLRPFELPLHPLDGISQRNHGLGEMINFIAKV
jgi:hypothetical protein